MKNNRTFLLDRLLLFISTPVHRYFYQSWDDKFDREMHFKLFFLTFLLWTMWSSYLFDFLSYPHFALYSFIIVLFRDVQRSLLALCKFSFFDSAHGLFNHSSFFDDRFEHQYQLKIFVLPFFFWVMWSLFSLFIPSANYFLNFLVFFYYFDNIVCILLKCLQHLPGWTVALLFFIFLFMPWAIGLHALFAYYNYNIFDGNNKIIIGNVNLLCLWVISKIKKL